MLLFRRMLPYKEWERPSLKLPDGTMKEMRFLKAEAHVKENVILNSPSVNQEIDMEGVHDLHELDSVQIDCRSYLVGLLKAITFFAIVALAFFVQFEINGKSDIMYKSGVSVYRIQKSESNSVHSAYQQNRQIHFFCATV